jgi:hypothetical protein
MSGFASPRFLALVLAIAAASPAAATPARTALPPQGARPFDALWIGSDSGTYNTARYLYASAVADLDGDGDPDVATSSWPNLARVTVLRNAGNGTFAQPDVYTIARASQEIVAADFTGDGLPDLVASNTDPNFTGTSVSLLRNLGGATFAPAVSFACGSGPVGLAAGDFDLDGDADLAVANWGFFGAGSTVSILENLGNGSFAAPAAYPAGTAPYRVVAADLDGDGALDLAVANGAVGQPGGTAALNLLRNDGAGGFATRRTLTGFFAGNSFFPAVLAADSDLDSDPDLFFADAGTDGIFAFENQGAGTFAAPTFLPSPPFSGGPNALAAGDLTGDGWPDLAGTHHENEGWTVVPSTGGGAFGAMVRYSAAEAPYDVEIADADRDGDLDPFVACRDSLEIAVQVNPGDGDFSPPEAHPVGQFSDFFDPGDIDGDGDLDLASAAGSMIQILRNPGDGDFEPATSFFHPGSSLDVKLRDLDADGNLDLLWNEENAPYRWGSAFNDGEGSFVGATVWPVPTCGYFKAEIEAFDLDGDEDLDVVQIENLACVNIPLSARRVFLNENVGGRSFRLSSVLVVNPNPRSVAGADLDHDGNLDLALTGQPSTILLGHGDLTFTQLSSANIPGINVASDDFDQDGHTDMAIALQRNVAPFLESMAVQLGNGDGTFTAPAIYLGSHSPDLAQISEILSGDVDRDGDPDVLASNYASNDVSIWRNAGEGTFMPHVRYGGGMASLDISYADFTGDGSADLATYSWSFPPLSQSIQLFEGRGLGRPPHVRRVNEPPRPVSR